MFDGLCHYFAFQRDPFIDYISATGFIPINILQVLSLNVVFCSAGKNAVPSQAMLKKTEVNKKSGSYL